MNEFDIKASGWDQNQDALGKDLWLCIEIRNIPLTKRDCPLGLEQRQEPTTLSSKDDLKEITLMDTSLEMIG